MTDPKSLTTAPMPTLQISDLLRLESWAMQGLGVDNIAVLLGMTPATFREMAEADPRINASLLFGRTKGIEAVSQSLFGSAISGKDAGAARWWLERLAGGEFRPPRANPIIVVEAAKPDPARELERADRISLMIERQRLLLTGRDFDQDGKIIDLEPVRKIPPPDDAEGGEV